MAAETLTDTAETLLGCVCTALDPLCACYHTIGLPMTVICCECEPGVSGEVSIHLERMYEADAETLRPVNRVRPCKRGTVVADFRLQVARCYPRINEQGEIPAPEDQTEAALALYDDASIVWQALACCPGVRLRIVEFSVDSPPEGGCSMLMIRVSAEVTTTPPAES